MGQVFEVQKLSIKRTESKMEILVEKVTDDILVVGAK